MRRKTDRSGHQSQVGNLTPEWVLGLHLHLVIISFPSDFHLKNITELWSQQQGAAFKLRSEGGSHHRISCDDDVRRACHRCKKYSSAAQIGSDSRISGKGSPQVERERAFLVARKRKVKMLRCGVLLLLFLHSLAFVCEASYGDEQPSYK